MAKKFIRRVAFGACCGLSLALCNALVSLAAGPQFGSPGMAAPSAGGGFGAPGQMQPRMSRQSPARSGGANAQQFTSPYQGRASSRYSSAQMRSQVGAQGSARSQSIIGQAKTVNRGR